MTRRTWTRNELIVTFNLYCKLRFGQCHARNPQVIKLATVLRRTPNAVAMKLCNFASFDPAHQQRGIVGLGNVSRSDRAIWDEFNVNWNQLGVESERVYRNLLGDLPDASLGEVGVEPTSVLDLDEISTAQTEAQRLQSVRLGQAFFRTTVLASYQERCCICGLPCTSLLIASHIIPWASHPALRLDPRNGLCLCALHDKAFDRGLISVNSEFRIIVSRQIERYMPHSIIKAMFIAFCDQAIHLPEKFRPNPEHLEYHRTQVFHTD
jgi:hypothetical protein